MLFGPFAPGTLDLREDSVPGMTITGARCREYAGTSVAAAGDVNGDGLDDVVIGAPGGSPDDEGLATESGRAYVVFGRRAGGSVELSRLGRLGIVIEGRRRTVTDAFGWAVDGAGDVDRDGLDDVVIAAPGNPGFEERSQRGAAYVVYGRRRGGTIRVRRLGRRGFRIAATDPGGLRSVAGAGDVDGDGRDDVILGDVSGAHRRGAAIVVRGARRHGIVRLGRLGRAGFKLTGRDRSADTGYAVDGGGDVNGDGLSDVIVGAPQGNRTPFNTAGGGAFVVFGRRAPRDVDLRALGARGIELRGSGSDWAGFAVASAGRIAGDRLGDVALLMRGSLAVVFGRRSAGTVRLDRLRPAAGLSDRRHHRAQPVVLRQRVRRLHHRGGRGRRRRRRRHRRRARGRPDGGSQRPAGLGVGLPVLQPAMTSASETRGWHARSGGGRPADARVAARAG